jgi:hypothetical protein
MIFDNLKNYKYLIIKEIIQYYKRTDKLKSNVSEKMV